MHRDRIHLRAPKNWINDPMALSGITGHIICSISIFPMSLSGAPCTGDTR